MECDLLLKEDEFYKENEKLELKTRQLMQKVNDVMKIQDNLIQDTLTQTELSDIRKSRKFAKKLCVDEIFDEDLPSDQPKAAESGGGVARIYKVKLKSVLAEKERILSDLRHKTDELKKTQKDNQSLKEEKEKWFLLYNSVKNNMGKLESQITNLNAKLQSKDTETTSLKKEAEHLKKELKTTALNFNNCDVRLSRACEEGEKLKAALKQTKDEERELKESHRKQMNEMTSNIKQLERQKIELLNGFKKQMQLIDVLKKQKMYLEAFKVGEMSDSEYLKILDWKFD